MNATTITALMRKATTDVSGETAALATDAVIHTVIPIITDINVADIAEATGASAGVAAAAQTGDTTLLITVVAWPITAVQDDHDTDITTKHCIQVLQAFGKPPN